MPPDNLQKIDSQKKNIIILLVVAFVLVFVGTIAFVQRQNRQQGDESVVEQQVSEQPAKRTYTEEEKMKILAELKKGVPPSNLSPAEKKAILKALSARTSTSTYTEEEKANILRVLQGGAEARQ
ncbi:MAG: hypothetical protein UY07_C0025G0005 [Parcubacteria group bacterium GW2011_GWA1_47_8]|nr:MAG: hypothetical protein UY07_C0025G0005 [Parcubacteria group bacterium GW2011_GWA1_47_8]